MGLQVQDFGELGYGGLVEAMNRWDKRREADGRIKAEDIFMKAGTYSYLVPGLICTTAVAINAMPRWRAWNERIAHAFIYDAPRFTMSLVDALGGGGGAGAPTGLQQAEQVLAASRSGRRTAGQSVKPGFEDVKID